MLCSAWLFSCDTATPPSQVSAKASLKQRIVVLADVSSSFSEKSAIQAAGYVAQIVEKMGNHTEIKIFAADDKTFDTPIFEAKKEIPLDVVDKETYLSNTWANQKTLAGNAVFNAWKRKLNKSCLLKGIKSVFNALQGGSTAEETYVLILSDMLECCDLGCPTSPAGFVKMEKKLAGSNLKDHPLAGKVPLENIQIVILNKEATEGNSRLMDSKEFADFWKKAFQQLGYSDWPTHSQDVSGFIERMTRSTAGGGL